MTIWFASGNVNKRKELSDILHSAISKAAPGKEGLSFEIKMPSEAGLDFDPDEKGSTFLENALIKAGELYRVLKENRSAGQNVWQQGDPVIADDSGLCVDALDGRPGIHSARYSGPLDTETGSLEGGKSLSADERNILLLGELGDNPRRSARFICAMVLYYGPGCFFAVQETMEGELVKNYESARGLGGFGYDPILYIPGLSRTVAELSEEEKNQASHRGKAGKAIANILYTKLTADD